ncbi:MAG: Ldh family oxidoreductase, partial [bacterium]
TGMSPVSAAISNALGITPDIAMSQAAVGKVASYRREGRKAPLDWGLDRAGNPTDDPAEILASKKFLPMGGHKGAGLALVFEMLTGALAGGVLCYELAKADPSGTDVFSSKLFLALDPAAFGDPARFEERVDDLLAYLQAAAKPGEVLLYPGQHGGRIREANLVSGVPVHNAIMSELQAVGVSLAGSGVDA